MTNQRHWLEIIEYVAIAASILGTAVAIQLGQASYGLVPLSLALLLNLVNRLRIEQRVRRLTNGAIAHLYRQAEELADQQQLELEAALAKLETQQPKALIPPEAPTEPQSPPTSAQLRQQYASLEESLSGVIQYLNRSSLPGRVEMLEQAIAKLKVEIARINRQPLGSSDSSLNLPEPRQPVLFTPGLAVSPTSSTAKAPSESSPTPTSSEKITPDPPELSPIPTSSERVTPPGWSFIYTLAAHSDWVRSLAISPDNPVLVTGSFDKSIKVWNIASGKLLRTLSKHSKGVFAIAISPDGQYLVSSSWDETIKLWQLETGELIRTLRGHTSSVRSLAISHDGQLLVSGGFDETIKLWELEKGELIDSLDENKGGIEAIALSPDAQLIASSGGDGIITLWQPQSRSQLGVLKGNISSVSSLAISPDSQKLAASCADGTVKLWHLEDREQLHVVHAHNAPVTTVIFSPDGQMVISGSSDGTIHLWNLETEERVSVLSVEPMSSIMSIAISPDAQIIASGRVDGTVQIWQREGRS